MAREVKDWKDLLVLEESSLHRSDSQSSDGCGSIYYLPTGQCVDVVTGPEGIPLISDPYPPLWRRSNGTFISADKMNPNHRANALRLVEKSDEDPWKKEFWAIALSRDWDLPEVEARLIEDKTQVKQERKMPSQGGALTKPSKVSGGLTINSVDDLNQVSDILSSSGLFSDAKSAAQCAVKVMAGLEMGIGAFAAMSGIHIIKGKPSVGAGVMAAAVKRNPRYDYRVLKHSAEECEIEFFERWHDGNWISAGISSLTMAQAKAARLHQDWDKQANAWKDKHNWKTYPKNMLFARVMSNGVKWYVPNVFDGPVYTPDELGAETDGDGNVIDVSAISVEPSAGASNEPTDQPITPEQRTAMFSQARANGWSDNQIKAVFQEVTGKPSSGGILASQYEGIYQRFSSAPAVQVDVVAEDAEAAETARVMRDEASPEDMY